MADPLFRLAYTLYRASMDFPDRFELPAGLSFAAVATLESYMNEVISMHFFLPGQTNAEQEPARRRVSGPRADVVGRLRRLREEAERPEALPESTLDDVQILVGLRGLLAHYDVQGEHPAETRTSLQRLAERVCTADQSASDVSPNRSSSRPQLPGCGISFTRSSARFTPRATACPVRTGTR